jgi:hypothetical protein
MATDFKRLIVFGMWLGAVLQLSGGCRYPPRERPAGMSRNDYSVLVWSFRRQQERPLPQLGCRRALRLEFGGSGSGGMYLQCDPDDGQPYAYSKKLSPGGAASGPSVRPFVLNTFDTFACHAVSIKESRLPNFDEEYCSFEVLIDGVYLVGDGEEGSPVFDECIQVLRDAGVIPQEAPIVNK